MNQSKKPHETDIERIMRIELERKGIEFVQFYPHRLGFTMDFALVDRGICIECDGKNWHKNKKRDNFRDYMLKRSGWTTIRFTDDEIKKDIISCVDKIKILIL